MKSHKLILAGALALASTPIALPALAQAPKPAAAMQFVLEQPSSEWLARVFLGADVMNTSGERVGDISDLLFDRTGRISTVVIGVGGFLGLDEKNVAVPYGALTYSSGSTGARIITVALTKDELSRAPEFKATEKTRMDTVKDKASDIGHKTMDKAVDIKNQAIKKIDDMTKTTPAKQ